MTAQLLASELAALISESKRKNPELRGAAEKSLSDLKALSNTSESQIAADLKLRPNFVRPFLIACATRNPKYAGIGIVSLQRLIASNGLPQETLKDVLAVLRECSSLGLDVQLKILQALPSLLQNYAKQLKDQLLANALEVCFLLYSSKTAAVSGTAAATLQQLVVSIIGKVGLEDELASEQEPENEVPTEDGTIVVRAAAFDAYRLFNDLALITEGQKPSYLRANLSSPDFGLELIESMLSNHADIICSHPELVHVVRIRLMPLIIRIISERFPFPTTVRAMRLLPMIFSNMLSVLTTECEMAISLLNHTLDPDAAVLWKRVLCMEVFRSIHAQPAIVRSMYASFDEHKGKRNVVRDHMDIMVRLAAEKPSVIGLGPQSSVPAVSTTQSEVEDEVAALQAEGVAGMIGSAMSLKASNVPGLTVEWSTLRVPCIDQLDKTEAPGLPQGYIYALTLICINSFSDGLARFLLPFSIPGDSRSRRKKGSAKDVDSPSKPDQSNGDSTSITDKKSKLLRGQSFTGSRIPVNPLFLESHVLYQQIQTSARMVENCWPALLAAYSTFLHAALDSEFYHSLVRSFQKFTQISGILRLSTPRDAFLTTLGKNAVPPSFVAAYAVVNSPVATSEGWHSRRPSFFQDNDMTLSPISSPAGETSRQSFDISQANLNTRNLLCMRALLNLGIALGPVLDDAWSIVLETLQQADTVVANSTPQRRTSRTGLATPGMSEAINVGELDNEIAAVKVAATRLLESCSELPNGAFLDVLSSLKALLKDTRASRTRHENLNEPLKSPLRPRTLHKQSSMSSINGTVGARGRANAFVIQNITTLIGLNSLRLLEADPTLNGWNIILDLLVDIVGSQDCGSDLRIKAAEAVSTLVAMTATFKEPERQGEIRQRGLATLDKQVKTLYFEVDFINKAARICELDIHLLSLETLQRALEQYGDSLLSGWDYVFTIIDSIFERELERDDITRKEPKDALEEPITLQPRSSKLVRPSFGSLELICSDFLGSVPEMFMRKLIDSVYHFCSQTEDFNISLTSTTLFWNVSDHLARDLETIDIEDQTVESIATPRGDNDLSKALLWLYLLNCLVDVTINPRPEIRHGALHTIFRIFDAYGDNLRPSDWMTCQDLIISRLLLLNNVKYRSILEETMEDRVDDLISLSVTGTVLLNSLASLFEHHLETMITHPSFIHSWKNLVGQWKDFLSRQALALSTAVFSALSRILAVVRDVPAKYATFTDLIWDLWQENNPVKDTNKVSPARSDNQPALLAYLQCLGEIYRLRANAVDLKDINDILEQLRICATDSSPMAYSGDIDKMTPLQTEILGCIEMIHPKVDGARARIIHSISIFVTLAYENDTWESDHKGPTYVSLSKAAMDLLKTYIFDHLRHQDTHLITALAESVSALATPISLKYTWKLEGKAPVTWQKATTITLAILEEAVPIVAQFGREEEIDTLPFWTEILNTCDTIMSADLDGCSVYSRILPDEDFDINAITKLRALLIPTLGFPFINDDLRRKYAESIFKHSIIHEPHYDDLPQPGQDLLECLASTHIGRVQELPPTPRSKMSYFLLDDLFSLVSIHRNDNRPRSLERINLAKASAPFLILRVGIVLKAYIFDQPLRGRMPQPISHRKELLYVLKKLVELDSEPEAFPQMKSHSGVGGEEEYKRHLHMVFEFVTKALRISRRDGELQRALTGVVECVGREFL